MCGKLHKLYIVTEYHFSLMPSLPTVRQVCLPLGRLSQKVVGGKKGWRYSKTSNVFRIFAPFREGRGNKNSVSVSVSLNH